MKLAIIDLDGVVANAEARFAKAEEVKRTYLREQEKDHTKIHYGDALEREANNVYWKTVFTPELVSLDTLIEHATEAIQFIEQFDQDSYQVFYLTSRPETMRQATEDWLLEHQLSGPKLIMKPSAAQYVKTVTWKALTVQMLASLYQATHVLFVDDEQTNRDAVIAHGGSHEHIIVASSLADAVAKLNGTWVEPDPFLPEE